MAINAIDFETPCTIKQMADYYDVTTPTIYAEARRGKFKISKIGRLSRILPEEQRRYRDGLKTLNAA